MSALRAAALALADRGYCVLPLQPGAKAPLTPEGVKNATRGPQAIARWWDRWPNANIGIACGASGIVVLDIDAKAGADPREILAGRDRAGAPVIGTGVAQDGPLVGRRGVHVPMRGEMRSVGRTTLTGVEIKAAGAYVVAPPSIHPCGAEYVGEYPPVVELPPVPDWLLKLVPAPRAPQVPRTRLIDEPGRILEGLIRVVRTAPCGSRNQCVHWSACRVVEHAAAGHLDGPQALEAIRAAAIEVGLPEHEIQGTLRSAQRTVGGPGDR